MTKTIIPNVHNFVATINQITEQLPDSGFDGLSDLLLLLNDVYAEQPQPTDTEIALSTEKINHVKNFAVAAEAHLFNAPEQGTVDKLISHIRFFAEEILLDDEDILMIQESLMQDQAPDSIESFSATFTRNREQIKLALQQAEAMGLNGILDVLYLVDEWQEEHVEDNSLPASSLSGYNAIIGAAQAYLSATGDQQLNANTLVNSLGQLDESLVLDNDDSSLLTNLLLEEANLIKTVALDAPAEKEKLAAEVTDTIQHYRQQLTLFLQQAEELELSGLLDILYLLDVWLNGDTVDSNAVPESSVLACGDIIIATQAYLLANGEQEVNINTILSRLGDLDDSLLLEEEDSTLLKNLLMEETALIIQSQTEPTEVVQDYDTEQDNRIEVIEIPPYLAEYVDILSLVFLPIQATIDKLYSIGQNQNSLTAIEDSDLENLKDDLEKLALISKTAEFIGLHLSTLHIQSNREFLINGESTIIHETIALFHEWSFSVIDYLNAPLNDEPIHKLLAIHCSPLWPVAIAEELATNLLIELQSLDRRAEASKAKERQHIASDEDVSLALPDDISPVLVDSLLEELPEQTATFSAAIEHLSQGGSMESVTVAQRVAHTLKGAGNTVNVRGIANLTHHLEDILTALADENILPDTRILATLRRASDCLEEMTETLTSNSPPPPDAVEVLQEILDVASRIDNEGITQIIQANSAAIVAPEVTPIQSQQPDKIIVEEHKEEKEEKESEQMVRLPVSTVDKLLQFSDEMIVNNGQLREQLKQAVAETKLLQAHLEQFHYHSMELLGHVDMQRIQQIQNQAISSANDGFDSLEMDQYNELYSTSLRIHEMTSDSREMNRSFANQLRGIDALLIEQSYLNGTSQSSLLDIRTIAVQSVVPRLQRGVRQAARMSGKDIDLQLSGQDLLVDKDILNSVLDPLMHLLRNAVGHGIESKADRIKAGKSEQGHIKLHFYRDKNMIAIDCIDDGGGLDLAAIKRKALKIGLISDDSDISDDEIKQLIMQPNFSTQDEVSQISGRGVGMDAVNSGIRSLGGTLRLESEVGKGCIFHILLPLSLAHHNCLLVNVGTQTLAVAELGIEQVLLADSGVLYPEGDEYSFVFDDKKYAVKTLESLLSRVSPNQKIAMQAKTFLLINQQENYFAIAVESVKSVGELIVKDLNDVLPHIHGIIGASTLNDGSISPVIDLQELLQEPSRWGARTDEQFSEESPIDQTKVLVVDDSLSARRSLEQFFSDMGYQIMSARDGLDALEQLESQVPDIIVTDLEMPRVNGIELTENLRRDEATKDLPIVMITSRATAKHRTMAVDKGVNAYLTKPYSEDELSSTVMGLLVNQ